MANHVLFSLVFGLGSATHLFRLVPFQAQDQTGSDDKGELLPQHTKAVGCQSPSSNEDSISIHTHVKASLSLQQVSGHRITRSTTRALFCLHTDHVHVSSASSVSTPNRPSSPPMSSAVRAVTVPNSAHTDSTISCKQSQLQSNQAMLCPYCCKEFKCARNINRHLERSCKNAPPGAKISVRASHGSHQLSQSPIATQNRASCPHCHIMVLNKNLNRHVRRCPLRKSEETGTLQGEDSSTCQTVQAMGPLEEPADQQYPHSVGVMEHSSLQHSPMTKPPNMMPVLQKLPRLHLPSAGSDLGKHQWNKLNGVVQKEVPHLFPGGIAQSALNNVVDKQTAFIRSLFPVAEISSHSPPKRSRSVVAPSLRRRLRDLRRQWRHRGDLSDQSTESLRQEYHVICRQIKRQSRLRNLQRDQLAKAKHIQNFRDNPYAYSKKLFSSNSNISPAFTQATAEEHFTKVYTDDERGRAFQDLPNVPNVPVPSHQFNLLPPSLSELETVIRKSRNGSSPGPNGVPYLVYKKLPALLRLLHKIFVLVWKSKEIPLAWRVAHMILLAKSPDTSHPSLMRNIALGNCEGKLFFSIIAHRMQCYMKSNLYFDGISQKGFMPGVSGCVEHASVLNAAVHDARRSKRSICITWVDFANAFGSVNHSLIQYALSRYHFPAHIHMLIYNYYDKLFAQVTCKAFSTDPFHYGIGVFQGCTMSPILFNIVMQILLDLVTRPANQHHAYKFKDSNDDKSLLCPAFADDMTVVTNTPDGNQHIANEIQEYCGWTGTMNLKEMKCVTIAYRYFSGVSRYTPLTNKRWSSYDPLISMNGSQLKIMDKDGFKYLGKLQEIDLGESCLRSKIITTLRQWMTTIESTPLLHVMKCWIYNYIIIPKLSWWFTVSSLSLDFSLHLHRLVLPYLKRWAGIPKGGNSAILFVGSRSSMGLGLKRIYTQYKAMQVVRRAILKKSADPLVQHVFTAEQSRQAKWPTSRFAPAIEVETTEALKSIVEIRDQNSGLGFRSQERHDNSLSVYQHFNKIDSEAQLAHTTSLVMQGQLQHCDSEMRKDFQWNKLITGCTDSYFKFVCNATNNSLPTPDNLSRWSNSVVQLNCSVCGCPRPTLKHILSHCYVSLAQGRFTWRHNKVLEVIYQGIHAKCQSINESHLPNERRPYITFVRQGRGGTAATEPLRRDLHCGLLQSACDWQVMADGITTHYSIPHEVAITSSRPDIVILSRSRKTCVLVELTVPMEDKAVDAALYKTRKYQHLCNDIVSNGWNCKLLTVEIGCRGNLTSSLHTALRVLGFTNRESKSIKQAAASTASRCSYFIYLRRKSATWTTPP